MPNNVNEKERLTTAYRNAAIRMIEEDGLRLEIDEDAAVEIKPEEGGAYVKVEDMFVSEDDVRETDYPKEVSDAG